MMKVSDVLIKAKALIDHPNKWVQGMGVSLGELGNWRYCSSGAVAEAVLRVIINEEQRVAHTGSMYYLAKAMPSSYDNVAYYNDHSTHADVMALFDRAIQLAKHDEEQLNKGDNNDDRQGSTTSRTESHQEAGELVTV